MGKCASLRRTLKSTPRRTVALFQRTTRRRRVRELFDGDFYGEQLTQQGGAGGPNLLQHYLEEGWRLGLDPCPAFSTSAYLVDYPDVALADMNPLLHFVARGKREGRVFRRSARGDERKQAAPDGETVITSEVTVVVHGPADPQELTLAERVDEMRRRDLAAYLAGLGIRVEADSVDKVDATYCEQRYGGAYLAEGAAYYWRIGWQLGHSPTPWFDSELYSELYPDVIAAGINPFAHFCGAGFREGRIPRSREFRRTELVLRAAPFDREWVSLQAQPNVSRTDLTRLLEEVGSLLLDGGVGLVVVVGHDDYRLATGGVQRCIRHDEMAFNQERLNVLVCHPYRPLRTLADPDGPTYCVWLTLNGERLPGPLEGVLLAEVMQGIIGLGQSLIAVIAHSLFGHSPEVLAESLTGLRADRWVWWVHDYYTACVNPTLTQDDVRFCGNPPIGSTQCRTCRYGDLRAEHVRRLEWFRASFPWFTIAPSEVAAAEVLRGVGKLSAVDQVLPHAAVTGSMRVGNSASAPLRIAFVGHPVAQKGWFTFENFVRERAGEGWELLHFGATDSGLAGARYVELSMAGTHPPTAEGLLVEYGIDAVLIWPEWPETFSFVTIEALAAGCAVITHPQSGNVAHLARAAGAALEYQNEVELLEDRLLGRKLLERRGRQRVVGAVAVTGLSRSALGIGE